MKKVIIPAAILCTAICIGPYVQPNREVALNPVHTPTPLQVEVTAAPPKMEIMVTETEEPDIEIIVPASVSSPIPMPTSTPTVTPTTAPTPTPSPTAAPVVSKNIQTGDMVYVKGFGWLESQGGNMGTYAEDMYESGNKVGIMD